MFTKSKLSLKSNLKSNHEIKWYQLESYGQYVLSFVISYMSNKNKILRQHKLLKQQNRKLLLGSCSQLIQVSYHLSVLIYEPSYYFDKKLDSIS